MLSYLGQVDSVSLIQAAGQLFNECGLEGCAKRSMGFVCVRCGQFACNTHVYFRFQAKPPKPLPVCAACVVASHPELTADE